MAHTITANNGGGMTEPLNVIDYSAELASRNVTYDLLDGSLGTVYVPPRPRSGTLRLVYQNRAAAHAAVALHKQPASFTYISSELAEVSMTYALEGSVRLIQDATVGLWYVEVGFQEVTSGL
ncbi:hypothetical protein [Microbacterium invictum]|uniref:Uncharacterized protein n=1 Tax=Microbacterium invictum TaxID=515415 RepID=A0ABZ0VHH8_9MICO|nr:hypothetical protein [Microbacterium invictum]WQB71960.1 hypothetical protein T9R20_08455 [Microbacterium invictum]